MAENISGEVFTHLDEMMFEEFLEYALENGEDYALSVPETSEIETSDKVDLTPSKSQTESAVSIVVGDRAFMEYGSCRGTDPEIFFPDYTDTRGEAVAQVVCRSCVVQSDCLDYALNNDEQSGVWGGMSEKDRSRLNRRRRNSRVA